MLNYLKKFAVDIFPSVAATVIGAYIVNHYIVTKPSADAPAAAASTANPKGDGKAEAKSDAKSESKSADTTASVSNLPAAGVKARGISEKAIMEKTAAERPAVAEKAQEKPGRGRERLRRPASSCSAAARKGKDPGRAAVTDTAREFLGGSGCGGCTGRPGRDCGCAG
jgi:hypothetical protein